MKIEIIKGREILNSAGQWTVECFLKLEDGREASASVPQGISTGKRERKPVSPSQAIRQIEEEIFPLLAKEEALHQKKLDQILRQEERWGSNATLAVSAAFAKASGFFHREEVKKLPSMMMLIFEGRKHGSAKIQIQEFMIVVEEIEKGREFYHRVEEELEKRGVATTVGSEGGFSPSSWDDNQVLSFLTQLGGKNIALDVAANQNQLRKEDLYDIVRRYPLVSLEDPVPENKPEKWKEFFFQIRKINPHLLVVADDLTVTDPEKIRKWGKEKLFNAVIIKPNQQGSISEAIEAIKAAKTLGLKTIVSHRGEETNDTWIADLAVKEKVDLVKFGASCRGERVAKYNHLLKLLERKTT